MDSMVMQKDDLESAKEYFDLYMSLRKALREGKIEISDVDAYLNYKELLLTPKARSYAQDMILKIKE